MEIVISGYIVAVLPCEQGTSQRSGQPWMKQGYVLQHEQGQYPKHICFEIFGQDKIQRMAIQYGEYLTVHLNADAGWLSTTATNDGTASVPTATSVPATATSVPTTTANGG